MENTGRIGSIRRLKIGHAFQTGDRVISTIPSLYVRVDVEPKKEEFIVIKQGSWEIKDKKGRITTHYCYIVKNDLNDVSYFHEDELKCISG